MNALRLLPLIALVGCLGPWQDEWNPTPEPSDMTPAPTDVTPEPTDVTPPVTEEPEYPDTIRVITGTDTVWSTFEVLDRPTFVLGNLTIEPGTIIRGTENGSLIVTTTGQLQAVGTADEPIVFTSFQDTGSRAAGDWSGVALLGNGVLQNSVDENGDSDMTDEVEGLSLDEFPELVTFGGDDNEANCGTLQYVRIEFAGRVLGAGDELNGLTVAGCGEATTLDHIQVHNTLDDGIEFFGGSATLTNALISRPGDDGLDWDQGWRGLGQYIVVLQDDIEREGELPDKGIEADSKFTAAVNSSPFLHNITLIGGGLDTQGGMTLRENTEGMIGGLIVQGFSYGVDISDENSSSVPSIASIESERTSQNALDGDLVIRDSTFVIVNDEMDDPVQTTSRQEMGMGNDNGFDENMWLLDNPSNEETLVSPLPPIDLMNPNLVPLSGMADVANPPTLPDSLDAAGAAFKGAVAPSGTPFYEGWTAFPVN